MSGRLARFESLEPRHLLSAASGLPEPAANLSFPDVVPVVVEALGYDEELGDLGPYGDATPTGETYLVYEHWGGAWHDTEKSPTNSEDDKLCWAAAASNILAWSGWGLVDGMSTADAMFAYFQDHWTDETGIAQAGWDWWFDGTNPTQGWSGWSQVDVPGGGFYPSESFFDHFRSSSTFSQALATIDSYLRDGYAVALGLRGPGGHSITCWGVNYNPDNPSEYHGIWVTDSDDDKSSSSPPDRLRYYEVAYSGDRWYLQSYMGGNSWYIDVVQGLEQRPSPQIIVGDHFLLPDTPNQTIPIYVAGAQQVEGLNFYVQIGDGGPESGGSDVGPAIQAVDVVTGTIFQDNNTGVWDLDNGAWWPEGEDTVPMFEGHETSTAPGTSVAAVGLLGTITIDTTGFFGGTWQLVMSSTANGPTDFAGLGALVTDGSITINSPPAANPDAATVAEGGTVTVLDGGAASLLANDTDPDLPGDMLSVDAAPVSGPSHGMVVLSADGTFSYTHDGSENFTDSFVYRVRDAAGHTATAEVTITVLSENDPPAAVDDAYSVDEDNVLTVAGPGVLENDADPEGGPLEAVLASGPAHGTLDLRADGSFTYTPQSDYNGPDSFTYRASDGQATSDVATVVLTVVPVADVTGRYVFYNNSAWDGYDPSASADDDLAIAPDKEALLPGHTAGFVNYTSYTGGLNGLMIDVDDLADPSALGTGDFEFRVGNQGDPQGWLPAPAPVGVWVRENGGENGADRITIIWEDYLAHDHYAEPASASGVGGQWLQVVVLCENTGLAEPDVFYFGNAVGETGNSAGDAIVNTTDEIAARHNPHSSLDPAALGDAFDFNRDQRVDLTDQIIARSHKTYFLTALKLIAPPALAPQSFSTLPAPPTGSTSQAPPSPEAPLIPEGTAAAAAGDLAVAGAVEPLETGPTGAATGDDAGPPVAIVEIAGPAPLRALGAAVANDAVARLACSTAIAEQRRSSGSADGYRAVGQPRVLRPSIGEYGDEPSPAPSAPLRGEGPMPADGRPVRARHAASARGPSFLQARAEQAWRRGLRLDVHAGDEQSLSPLSPWDRQGELAAVDAVFAELSGLDEI